MKQDKTKNNQRLKKLEKDILREKFIYEFSKKKGWNPNELSTTQMLEIARQSEYQNPKLNY